MTTFYLVRHGTTAWVDGQILHGITDIPLNDRGKDQARTAAKALKGIKADFLFSSPLSRAMQTAQTIGRELDLDPVPIEEMKEVNFGWMEGKKIKDEVFDSSSSMITWVSNTFTDIIRAISGDTKKKFSARVLRGWEKIQAQSQGRDTVFVGHSAVLNVIMQHQFGNRYINHKKYYSIHPCAITEITIDKSGKAELVRLDDYSHLAEWYPGDD